MLLVGQQLVLSWLRLPLAAAGSGRGAAFHCSQRRIPECYVGPGHPGATWLSRSPGRWGPSPNSLRIPYLPALAEKPGSSNNGSGSEWQQQGRFVFSSSRSGARLCPWCGTPWQQPGCWAWFERRPAAEDTPDAQPVSTCTSCA